MSATLQRISADELLRKYWQCAKEESSDNAQEIAEEILFRIDTVRLYAVVEARADEARKCAADFCLACQLASDWNPAELVNERPPTWAHKAKNDNGQVICGAMPIHERLHRESQKGGNHAKTETQTGAD